MTKTAMVDKLNEAGLGTKTALRKLGEEELAEMVAKLDEGGEPAVQVDEPTVTADEDKDEVQEPTEEPTEDEKEEEEVKVLSEANHQLGIFTELIYHVKNRDAKVIVENIGYGDAYVCDGEDEPTVGNKDIRITTGDKKVIEGAKIVRAIAASQPELKITEIE